MLASACAVDKPGDFVEQSFAAFEPGQVRPLAISADGNCVYALHTPDNRLEIFRAQAGVLTSVASVMVGLEPVALAVRSAGELGVVNHLSDSVSIVDISTPTRPRVMRTLLVGRFWPRSRSALIDHAEGGAQRARRLWCAPCRAAFSFGPR